MIWIRGVQVALAAALVTAVVGVVFAFIAITSHDPSRADLISACIRTSAAVVSDRRSELDDARTQLEIATNAGTFDAATVQRARDAAAALAVANTNYQSDVARSVADPGSYVTTCKVAT